MRLRGCFLSIQLLSLFRSSDQCRIMMRVLVIGSRCFRFLVHSCTLSSSLSMCQLLQSMARDGLRIFPKYLPNEIP